MQNEYVLVFTTVASEEDAARLARELIEARLAACVHIDAVRSVYRWQGKLHDEPEWRLSIKTTAARYAELELFIKTRHTYETPEIVRIEIAGGSQKYLEWIGDCVE
jgi:periplasmic divalent cation tolerance protein